MAKKQFSCVGCIDGNSGCNAICDPIQGIITSWIDRALETNKQANNDLEALKDTVYLLSSNVSQSIVDDRGLNF